MSCNTNIQPIIQTEYIGNSLEKINTNFANLRDGVNSTCTKITSASNILTTLQNTANILETFVMGRAKAWVVFDGTKDESGVLNPGQGGRYIVSSYNIVEVYKSSQVNEGGGDEAIYGIYEVYFDMEKLGFPEELEPGEYPPYGVVATSSYKTAVGGGNRPTWAQPIVYRTDSVVIEVSDGQQSPYYADPDRVTVVIF